MARYTGPVYKKSRRLGFSILENGKELAKRPYAPGAHGNDKKKDRQRTEIYRGVVRWTARK